MGGRGQSIRRGGSTPRAGTRGTPSGYTLSDLRRMSDDQLADFINETDKNTRLDGTMNNVPYQRFMVALGINEKPEVVSEDEFAERAENSTALYRTVNSIYGLTADEMINQLINGDMAYAGKGVYGDGTYFSDNGIRSRAGYGWHLDENPETQTVVAILNDKAKIVDYSQLRNEYNQFRGSHPKAAKALQDAGNHQSSGSYISQFAMYKGYNVIVNDTPGQGNNTYYNVLDRSVLTTAGTRVVPTQNNPNPRS